MTNPRLLDAVDALTKPSITHVKQTDDDGTYLRTVSTEHPPLLQQLADAVLPGGSNDHGGQAASASARNVLDSQALYELMMVQRQLLEWCGLVHIRGDRNNLVSTLRNWYVAYQPLNKPATTDEWYTRELNRWARTIETRLDRNIKQFDSGHTCPICKTATWTDEHGDRQPARIIVSYKRDEDGRTHDEQATCQRCRESWPSIAAIQELSDELQERHAHETEDATQAVA